MGDEIASLEVSGLTLSNWEGITIQRSLTDPSDAFSFSTPFDHNVSEFRKTCMPFGYQPVSIKVDGEQIISGIIEQVSPSIDSSGSRINIQGRSPSGAMLDCNFDPPYQFDGQTWCAIAEKIAKPFGIKIDKTTDTGKIKIAKASTGDTALGFLDTIAKGEGFNIVSTDTGSIKLLKPKRSTPAASIVEGVGSFLSATLSANGTARFSKTKAIKSMGDWQPVDKSIIDIGVGIFRPRIITANGDAGSVQKSAEWALSQSIAESCTVDVVVTGWKNDAGRIWTPGDFVTLKSPSTWIMRESEFIISGVNLELSTSGRTTTLSLVLPEAFLGGVPAHYPWDDVFVVPESSRRFM